MKYRESMRMVFARLVFEGQSGAEAARGAGYSERYADRKAYALMQREDVRTELARLRNEADEASVATWRERAAFLTGVMRGEAQKVTVGMLKMDDVPTVAERMKAADLLGRMQGDGEGDGGGGGGKVVLEVVNAPRQPQLSGADTEVIDVEATE